MYDDWGDPDENIVTVKKRVDMQETERLNDIDRRLAPIMKKMSKTKERYIYILDLVLDKDIIERLFELGYSVSTINELGIFKRRYRKISWEVVS